MLSFVLKSIGFKLTKLWNKKLYRYIFCFIFCLTFPKKSDLTELRTLRRSPSCSLKKVLKCINVTQNIFSVELKQKFKHKTKFTIKIQGHTNQGLKKQIIKLTVCFIRNMTYKKNNGQVTLNK